MKIVAISDTHMQHDNLQLPEGDVLIHAGDSLSTGSIPELVVFLKWFATQPHARKILIAGNHDWVFEKTPGYCKELLWDSIIYLQDSGCTIDGVKFWGSPWQPTFFNWAFNRDRGPEIRRYWDMIPRDTNVLITHGPPEGIRDQTRFHASRVGCEDLREVVLGLPRLKAHVFGHNHAGYGTQLGDNGTLFVNASICNESYVPVNLPICFEIS
jgi:predicted phosphodiesterase